MENDHLSQQQITRYEAQRSNSSYRGRYESACNSQQQAFNIRPTTDPTTGWPSLPLRYVFEQRGLDVDRYVRTDANGKRTVELPLGLKGLRGQAYSDRRTGELRWRQNPQDPQSCFPYEVEEVE